MPRGDGTGPNGMGPGTGRGFGPCTGYSSVPFAGCGHGRGYRWVARTTGLPGWQRYGYVDVDQDVMLQQEKADLENQVRFLENRLNQVKDQLKKRESKE